MGKNNIPKFDDPMFIEALIYSRECGPGQLSNYFYLFISCLYLMSDWPDDPQVYIEQAVIRWCLCFPRHRSRHGSHRPEEVGA